MGKIERRRKPAKDGTPAILKQAQGRPTAYGPWADEMVEAYDITDPELAPGSNAQLAKYLGVNLKTFSLWLTNHRSLLEAVMRLRMKADLKVEAAMYHRALGYTIPNRVVKTEAVRVKVKDITGIALDPDEEAEEITLPGEKVTVTESSTHIPSDTAAAKFWLINRRHEEWTEKKTVEIKDERWGAMLRKIEAQIYDLPATEYDEKKDEPNADE